MTSMPFLSLTLLGGFETRLADRAVRLPIKKTQALLAYGALHAGRAQSREKLATLLWGDSEDDHARNSLRQALFVLRAALPAGWARQILSVNGNTVTVDPALVSVDVVTFEQLMVEGTPEALGQAVELYRGDLLEGFSLDEEPFEEWLFHERERLRGHVMEVLAKLLRHQREQGSPDVAIATARRLLTLDPCQEPVHRVLMSLLARTGRLNEARQQYEHCVDALKRELALEPEAETQQLWESLAAARRFRPAKVGRPLEGAAPRQDGERGPASDASAAAAAGPDPRPHPDLPPWPHVFWRASRACERSRLLVEACGEQRDELRRALRQNAEQLKTLKAMALGAEVNTLLVDDTGAQASFPASIAGRAASG
jgi:DNA-binding SARP family transcriptional activator